MNAPRLEPTRWSRRGWWFAVTFGVGVQVGLLFLFSDRSHSVKAPEVVEARTHLTVDEAVATSMTELPGLVDPTLFALPHHHGFSGAAWLQFTPLEHHADNWDEPLRSLPLETVRLGEAFAQFVATNTAPPLLIADKPAPRPVEFLPPITNTPALTASSLRVEGGLATRSWQTAPAPLPVWPYADVLPPTEVRMLVDGAGHPESVALLGAGCGLKAADQFALEFAARLEFEPAPKNATTPRDTLTGGKLIFQWHSVPLPTNKVAGSP